MERRCSAFGVKGRDKALEMLKLGADRKLRAELREPSVRLPLTGNLGYVDSLHVGQHEFINLSTADNHDLLMLKFHVAELFEVMDDCGSRSYVISRAGEDDILSAGQGTPKRFPRFAPHQDGVAKGKTLEELEVFRKLPRHGVIESDCAVCSHGNYTCECRHHTEMGALM